MFRERLPLLLAFAAGTLLGAACFHLMPESLQLSRALDGSGRASLVALAGGILFVYGLKKLRHARMTEQRDPAPLGHPRAGALRAAALACHSFFDGVGIGLAFQVSQTVGLVVALAVVAHDFCDGLSTVSLMLAHSHAKSRVLGMLAVDAVAPALGAASTLVYQAPPEALALCLGFLAGLLMYLGACDILPLARACAGAGAVAAASLIGPTALGASLVYGLTRVVH